MTDVDRPLHVVQYLHVAAGRCSSMSRAAPARVSGHSLRRTIGFDAHVQITADKKALGYGIVQKTLY